MRASDIPSDPLELAEPPVAIDLLRNQLAAWPDAAQIALDLLRSINLDDPARGVAQESLAYGLLQGSHEHAAWLSRRKPAPAFESGQVRVSRDGDVIDICLDRPAARNAIDRPMRDALHDAFSVAALDPDVSKVRLSGVGKAFCVGADLSEFGTTRDPAMAHGIRMQTLPALAIIRCAHKFEAHVQGACVGSGLEMAAFAKRLTASPEAWFQLPELAMGLIPGAGGCVSVPRRIGRRRAALMILSGRRISARVALDWGLIDAIVDD
jgi:1,4-dihydroxy-2-naphthoyl-CoA synthase